MEYGKDVKILKHYYKTADEKFEVGEIGVDFEPDLRNRTGADETITSATFRVFLDEDNGTETTSTMTSGSVDISGSKVSKAVVGGIAGKQYICKITIVKSGGGICEGFLGLTIRELDYVS